MARRGNPQATRRSKSESNAPVTGSSSSKRHGTQAELDFDNSAGKGGDALEASMASAETRSGVEAGAASDETAASRPDGGTKAEPEQIAPDQVKQWARKLNVPAPRLREAMRRVGPSVSDVKQFLEGSTGNRA
jgi:hypothetical protein